MATCEACGKDVQAGLAFCTSCGARVAPDTPADPAGEEDTARDYLLWSRKIPLITNPYLVLQCIAIPLGIGIFLGLLFWLIVGAFEMLTLFLVIGAGLAVLFLLIMLVLQIVTGGGLETDFFICEKGVAHHAGKTTRMLDRASAGGSAVMGSMSGTGAGLIAISQEDNMLEWGDVKYISVYPSTRSIVFRSRYLISPVVLYCRPDNFENVLAMIRKYAPQAAARKV